MKDIRIAAVTFNSPIGRSRENLDRMEHWVKEAGKQGAAIICFPEMNITGYRTNSDIIKAALRVPGTVSQDLQKLAGRYNMVILAGIAEKDGNNRIFASHLVVKPHGEIGIYRKVHPAPPEKSIFEPGNDIPLFTAYGLTFGIQLCYDTHFPELSTIMALQGADAVFLPHASPRGTPDEKFMSWMRHLPARAYDNGLFIIACNQTGDNGAGLNFPGIAMIIGPSGDVLDKDLSDAEGLLITDLKAADLDHVRKHRMRYFLPNRRPGLYRLTINP